MRRFLWIVLFALSGALLPTAAGAHHLTIDDVRNMALARGVVTIKEIELDNGIWEVQGRDAGGHKIEIKVDALSGDIVKKRRND
jgi:uncharacterized membrane protein YkoI